VSLPFHTALQRGLGLFAYTRARGARHVGSGPNQLMCFVQVCRGFVRHIPTAQLPQLLEKLQAQTEERGKVSPSCPYVMARDVCLYLLLHSKHPSLSGEKQPWAVLACPRWSVVSRQCLLLLTRIALQHSPLKGSAIELEPTSTISHIPGM
jgi:hypothetical protein